MRDELRLETEEERRLWGLAYVTAMTGCAVSGQWPTMRIENIGGCSVSLIDAEEWCNDAADRAIARLRTKSAAPSDEDPSHLAGCPEDRVYPEGDDTL